MTALPEGAVPESVPMPTKPTRRQRLVKWLKLKLATVRVFARLHDLENVLNRFTVCKGCGGTFVLGHPAVHIDELVNGGQVVNCKWCHEHAEARGLIKRQRKGRQPRRQRRAARG